MGYYKKASAGKMFYLKNEENELLQASEVSAPNQQALDLWLEFDSEEEARFYFGIIEEQQQNETTE